MKNFRVATMFFAVLFHISCGSNYSECVQDCHEEHPGYSKPKCEAICNGEEDNGTNDKEEDDGTNNNLNCDYFYVGDCTVNFCTDGKSKSYYEVYDEKYWCASLDDCEYAAYLVSEYCY